MIRKLGLASLMIAALLASSALAADYGHGRFVGKAKPAFGGGLATPIIIKVKGSRVRVVEVSFSFDCASDGSVLKRTISTPFTRVRPGPPEVGRASTAT